MPRKENPATARVPALRFPEFRDAGEWNKCRLDKVATFYNGRAYAQDELLEEGKYKVLRVGNFFTNNNWYYSDIELDETKYCDTGDLLYAWSASFGPRIWQGGKVIYHYHIWRVDNKDGTHKGFLYNVLASETERIKSSSANGLGLMHVTKGAIESRECYFPEYDEQKKITDCLSSLDELIAAEVSKVEALKAHKKGLMQQLFPAEGQTIPALRFPEFRDAGEWMIKSFGDLFTIGSGKDYKHLSSGDVPVYGSGGYMLSVNDFLHEGESVCIGRKGTINNPIFLTGKFWTVDTLFYTHSFKECLPRFIYLIFQNIEWLKHNEAGGVPSLSKTNIEKICVAVPKEDEQQKIADCLSSLDELIVAQASKVEALKAHKKGLMQQLFPTNHEDAA